MYASQFSLEGTAFSLLIFLPFVAYIYARLVLTSYEDTQSKEVKPFIHKMLTKATEVMLKAKVCSLLP